MTTVTINVTALAAREKIERLAKVIGPGPLLKVIGLRLLSYVDESFKTRGRGSWHPLAQLTLAMRARGGDAPLQDRGRYKQSFVKEVGGRVTPGTDYATDDRTFVEVGSNVKTPSGIPLGKIHEHGTGPFVIRVKQARTLAARLRSGEWVRFGKQVNHPGIPARPVLPTAATAERLVVEAVEEQLRFEETGKWDYERDR